MGEVGKGSGVKRGRTFRGHCAPRGGQTISCLPGTAEYLAKPLPFAVPVRGAGRDPAVGGHLATAVWEGVPGLGAAAAEGSRRMPSGSSPRGLLALRYMHITANKEKE